MSANVVVPEVGEEDRGADEDHRAPIPGEIDHNPPSRTARGTLISAGSRLSRADSERSIRLVNESERTTCARRAC